MTRALVVYESMFGNTETVAKAVAAGLADRCEVDVVEVGVAPGAVDGVELLVVGGPTHALGMSRPTTREEAASQAENGVVSAGEGLREWLARLRIEATPPAAAAFDTRVDKPRVPGSAARAALRRLRRLGCEALAPAESFYVGGVSGPLADGEAERAHRWAATLATALAETAPSERPASNTR